MNFLKKLTASAIVICFTPMLLLSLMGLGQQNIGPVTTPQINSTLYVGTPGGFYSTIQSAVTKACNAANGNRVVIPFGFTATDTIGGVTGGCTKSMIVDERVIPSVQYQWNGTTYVAVGGGGAVLPKSANGIASDANGAGRAQTLSDIQAITGNPTVGTDQTAPIATAQSTANAALAQSGAASIGAFSLVDTSHLLAIYNFKETSGTVLTDVSGNANNGTIAGTPIMSGAGYSFNTTGGTTLANITLPTALNATNTFYFAVYFTPTLKGLSLGDNNNLSALLTSGAPSGSTASLRIGNYGPINGGNFSNPKNQLNLGVYSLGTSYSNDLNHYNNGVAVGDAFAGFHVVALTCPSGAPAQFYLDGQALKNVSGTASCYNIQAGQTSYSYIIGSSPSTSYFYPQNETFYEAAFFSTVHSAQQVQQNSAALRQAAANKGGLAHNQTYYYTNPINVFAGDSILCGYRITGDSPSCDKGTTSSLSSPAVIGPYLNNTNYVNVNQGVPNSIPVTQLVVAPFAFAPYCNTGFGQSNFIMQGGTNEYSSGLYPAPSVVFAKLASLANTMNAAGCRPIVMTLIDRLDAGTATEQAVQAYNTYLRATYKSSRYVALIDVASDPILGKTGAANNSTYFNADFLHLTAAGELEEAKAEAAVINGLDGSNADSLNPTVQTTTSYGSIAVKDGGLNFNPDTNGANITATLFSAMWLTGRNLKYCNVGATYNVVLTAPADAGFNNGTAGNTDTIAPGTCHQYRATFNENPAAPVSYWRNF